MIGKIKKIKPEDALKGMKRKIPEMDENQFYDLIGLLESIDDKSYRESIDPKMGFIRMFRIVERNIEYELGDISKQEDGEFFCKETDPDEVNELFSDKFYQNYDISDLHILRDKDPALYRFLMKLLAYLDCVYGVENPFRSNYFYHTGIKDYDKYYSLIEELDELYEGHYGERISDDNEDFLDEDSVGERFKSALQMKSHLSYYKKLFKQFNHKGEKYIMKCLYRASNKLTDAQKETSKELFKELNKPVPKMSLTWYMDHHRSSNIQSIYDCFTFVWYGYDEDVMMAKRLNSMEAYPVIPEKFIRLKPFSHIGHMVEDQEKESADNTLNMFESIANIFYMKKWGYKDETN